MTKPFTYGTITQAYDYNPWNNIFQQVQQLALGNKHQFRMDFPFLTNLAKSNHKNRSKSASPTTRAKHKYTNSEWIFLFCWQASHDDTGEAVGERDWQNQMKLQYKPVHNSQRTIANYHLHSSTTIKPLWTWQHQPFKQSSNNINSSNIGAINATIGGSNANINSSNIGANATISGSNANNKQSAHDDNTALATKWPSAPKYPNQHTTCHRNM